MSSATVAILPSSPVQRIAAAWLDLPELMRAVAALLLCGGLLASDLVTSVHWNEAQLYPLALIPLYRVQSRLLIWAVAGVAVGFTILGYWAAPPDDPFGGGIVNRLFAILLVGMTALAMIKVAQYEVELVGQSVVDPLTGLLNRRRFGELTAQEEARARRHGQPLSVLMLDIDHFKRINDSHGHGVGDLAIKALAGACAARIRPHDVLARFGGEEFVLCLPQTDTEGALVVAERIRKGVEQIGVTAGGRVIQFTVSIGIATYRVGQGFDELLQCADEALYRAKQNGRNRVELHARMAWRPRSVR